MIATAGNTGDKTRSDCFVNLQVRKAGGIQLEINSKVGFLYNESIQSLLRDMLKYFDIKHARIELIDQGALPFVIAARAEAAIKKLIHTEKQYLLDVISENSTKVPFDKPRLSRLYLPGNSPSMMLNAGIHNPYAIILDLEDSVAAEKKQEARFLVRNALRSHNFMSAERMVRINQLPQGLDDLDYVIPHSVHTILIPKVENAEQICLVNERIESVYKNSGQSGTVWLIPIIETAMGVLKSLEIAQSSENIVAMSIGLEDYTADIGAQRTYKGKESQFAKAQVLNACKAVRIQALDSVFSDISDIEALKRFALESKSLGFDGMGCIHPRQLKTINECYSPNESDIEHAKKILIAYNEATEKGLGVVSLGTKMIDLPVVKRAAKILNLAIETGKLNPDWMNNSQIKS
jgi:citrate lyase subunit beta / citryl-CoA lyase